MHLCSAYSLRFVSFIYPPFSRPQTPLSQLVCVLISTDFFLIPDWISCYVRTVQISSSLSTPYAWWPAIKIRLDFQPTQTVCRPGWSPDRVGDKLTPNRNCDDRFIAIITVSRVHHTLVPDSVLSRHTFSNLERCTTTPELVHIHKSNIVTTAAKIV